MEIDNINLHSINARLKYLKGRRQKEMHIIQHDGVWYIVRGELSGGNMTLSFIIIFIQLK